MTAGGGVDAAMFAWLATYPNFYTVCDLLRADQYVTLRQACESLMPHDDDAEIAAQGDKYRLLVERMFCPDYGDNDEGRNGWRLSADFLKRGNEPHFYGDTLASALAAVGQQS